MCIIEYSNIIIQLCIIIFKNSFRSRHKHNFHSCCSLCSVDTINSLSSTLSHIYSYTKHLATISSLFIIGKNVDKNMHELDFSRQNIELDTKIETYISVCTICQKNLINKIIFRQNDLSYCRKCCPWKRKSIYSEKYA